MQSVIKIVGLTKNQINTAYYSLYDEYGYIINSWSKDKLKNRIKDYWKSKEK